MYDNYNYPPGADNERAPWNEVEIPEREFDVKVEYSLSKKTSIESNNYYIDESPDGSYIETDINWSETYNEQHESPLQLISLFKKKLEEELTKTTNRCGQIELEHLIEECSGWVEDYYDAYENK